MVRDVINSLTSDIFDLAISNNDKVIIMVKAPWCSSCNSVYPQFEESAKENKDVFYAVIDADSNQDFCFDKLGIRSLPTYIYYVNGEQKDFIVGPKNKSFIEKSILKNKE